MNQRQRKRIRSVLDEALMLHQRGQLAAAASLYQQVLLSSPRNAEALHQLGVIAARNHNFLAAIELINRAIELEPDSAAMFSDRGIVLQNLNLWNEALASYDRALAIEPDHAQALNNRGVALHELKRFDEALASCTQAVTINPRYSQALYNRGRALQELQRFEEALGSYDGAVAIEPGYIDALYNRSVIRLRLGRLREGWPGYEWRWAESPVKPPQFTRAWNGESLSGRSIVVFTEQGRGDIFQFARYLPLLVQRGAKVTFLVPPSLIRLMGSLDADITLTTALSSEPFDFQCALMSLPLWFGTDLDSIPAIIPYLKADPNLVLRWGDRIGKRGFKVGIAWQGNPQHKIDKGRSIPWTEFASLAPLTGARLISLQKHHGLDQLARTPSDVKLEILDTDFDDGPDAFVDTAAVMENLDLIITSDTSIAHLAGALARPTWLALKHIPDWRWMLGRVDSPWYPTMRLFRQRTDGNRKPVFEEIRQELRKKIGE